MDYDIYSHDIIMCLHQNTYDIVVTISIAFLSTDDSSISFYFRKQPSNFSASYSQ